MDQSKRMQNDTKDDLDVGYSENFQNGKTGLDRMIGDVTQALNETFGGQDNEQNRNANKKGASGGGKAGS